MSQTEAMATTSSVDEALEHRFEDLVASHRDRALRLAWRLVGGDDAAAQDVVQDAFVRAFRGLARFRGESSLETWFFRILVRQAHNHRRWRALRSFLPAAQDDPPDPRTKPEGDPALRRRIGAALDRLSARQRDVFVLVHMEGMTVREAADLVGCREGTAKSHLHRALVALRHELADLDDPGDDR